MGVTEMFQAVTDGGVRQKHYECRVCGENLDRGQSTCPRCDGDVAVYEL